MVKTIFVPVILNTYFMCYALYMCGDLMLDFITYFKFSSRYIDIYTCIELSVSESITIFNLNK